MEASPVESWPAPVRAFIHETYGDPEHVERLGGMGQGSVHRAQFVERSVIVKASPSDKEFNFYRSVAPTLAQLGVTTPRLEWSARIAGSCWLILEDIPCPLPEGNRQHWRADRRVLATLCGLHAATTDEPIEMPGLFEPRWTAEMTHAALSQFPSSTATSIAPVLTSLQHEGQHLFEPRCSISGDPNPTNWGVRRDGTVVLFDWERFCRGTPAIDLAIIVPGLGNTSASINLARDYSAEWQRTRPTNSLPWSTQQLSRDISVARVWTVVEFLANHATNESSATGGIAAWLVDAVPSWIDNTFE